MIERFRFLAGEFRRLWAASDFLDAQKVTKEPLGGWLRMSAPRSYSPPLDPILRGPQLSGLGSRRKGAGGSADQFPFYYRCR